MITHHLGAKARNWRSGLQEVVRSLRTDPAGVDASPLRSRPDARLQTLEDRMKAKLDDDLERSIPDEDLRNMYRLLRKYRGVSEELVRLVERRAAIDWDVLREARL